MTAKYVMICNTIALYTYTILVITKIAPINIKISKLQTEWLRKIIYRYVRLQCAHSLNYP